MSINKEYILNLFNKASKKSDYTWITYQPINCEGFEATRSQSGRLCEDRSRAVVEHIKKNISNYQNKIYIDWGCNLGYFVFDLMKNGCQSIGVDREKEYINICSFVKSQYDNTYKKPNFFIDEMNKESLQKYSADIGMCFSVLHHLKKDKFSIADEFAKQYTQSYIEMDGNNYGYDFLKVFYWDLDLVVKANDKYGAGTRKRKTWFCNNIIGNYTYKNIKSINLLSGRGAFKKTNTNNNQSVFLKREKLKFEHTWIKTDINYEAFFYNKYKTHFFPDFISFSSNDEDRILEIEFIDNFSQKGNSLENIFRWLEEKNLYIVDLSPSQFIKTTNGYVLTDLESIIHKDQINNRLKKSIDIKSTDHQLQYIKKQMDSKK
jgi:hypothetical protein